MSTVSNLLMKITKLWPFANQPSSVTPWVMSAGGIKLLASGETLESPSLIIPRKFLFYQCIDLGGVPRALRSNLLQQRIRQLSPFANPASSQIIEANQAQIWFWDADRVASQHQAQDLPSLSVIPEIMLYPPLAQGLRLQACLEGWELQYWSANLLRHSRWFAARPTPRDQADFVRVCGADEQSEWSESPCQLLPKPWNEQPFWSKANLLSEAVAPRLLLGLLLAWLCIQIGLNLGVQIKEKILASTVASKTQRLIEVVRQRDGAMQQQEFNQAILALLSVPSQLHLVAEVRACLAAFNYSILDWQYQRGQITLLLQQDNLDTRALIEACNKTKTFADVRAEPGITPNQTSFLLTLPAVAQGEKDAQ